MNSKDVADSWGLGLSLPRGQPQGSPELAPMRSYAGDTAGYEWPSSRLRVWPKALPFLLEG